MKKLMIAVAVAAMAGGVFAVGDNGQAYNVKMTLKTITDVDLNCKNGVKCTICEDEQGPTTPAAYKKSTVKINGFIVNCSPCEDRTAKKTRQEVNAAYFYNKTEKDSIGYINKFDAKTVVAATNAADVLSRKDLNGDLRIRAFGNSTTKQNNAVVELEIAQAEGHGEIDFRNFGWAKDSTDGSYDLNKKAFNDEKEVDNKYILSAIGFGTIKKGIVSCASGNVVGFLPYWNPLALYNVNAISCADVDYCTLTLEEAKKDYYLTNLRPAYGTFTIKNNAAAGKNGKYLYELAAAALK